MLTSSLVFINTIRADDSDPWNNPSWLFRKEITIDHTKVVSTLNEFPVLIDIIDSDLTTKCQPNGNDIVFTDDTGIKLDHEIELFDNSNGHLVAWVQLPVLSSTTDTTLYMYYGNYTISNQQNPTAVWEPHYVAVHHFDETTGSHIDATKNNYDGLPNGVNQNVVGKINGADSYDGLSNYVTIPNSGNINYQQLTLEAWIYPNDASQRQMVISKYRDSDIKDYCIGIDSNRVYIWYENGEGDYATKIGTIPDNTWSHVAVVYTGLNSFQVYINGDLAGSATNTLYSRAQSETNIDIGRAGGTYNTYFFDGIIDEVRISSDPLNAAWIKTGYNNQVAPSTFYTLGAEESITNSPLIYNEDPEHGAKNIPISISQLSFSIASPEDKLMNYTVTTIPNIGTGSDNNVGAGNYVVPISGLDWSTAYTWIVNVTDGVHWTEKTLSFTMQPQEPVISEIYPTDQETNYNPYLSVQIHDFQNDPLNVSFKTNATGTWTTLGTYYGGNGNYTQRTTGMDTKNGRYYWSINITDYTTWTNKTYTFLTKPFVLKWNYNLDSHVTVGPLAADVDNDGIYEVFISCDNSVTCFDGKTGEIRWKYNNNYIHDHSQFEIGDLNNDGTPEIVIPAGYRTIALHADDGTEYWNVNAESSNKNVIIADIEGNGYPYVYIASDDTVHGPDGTGRLRKLRGTDGAILAEVFVYRPCYGSLSFADINNDGEFEVFMTDRRVNLGDIGYGMGKGMQCFDAETLERLWYEDSITCSSNMMALIDVNNDSILDAVALQESAFREPGITRLGIYVIDGATGEKMPGKWSNNLPISTHSTGSIYDIDGDGNLELATNSGKPIKIWDLNNWALDATLDEFFEPPTMANVIGDEHLEIIGAEADVKIYDGSYHLIETIDTSAEAQTVVQDIDGDGQNELILVSSGGMVQVYETSAYAPDLMPRSHLGYYSERRLGTGTYVPPPGAPQPILKEEYPTNASQFVEFNPTLSIHAIDFRYDLMNITISTNASGIWEDVAEFSNTGNSVYTYSPTNMDGINTTYYWRVTAVDPYGDNLTTIKTYHFTTDTTKPPQISLISNEPANADPGNHINITSTVTDDNQVGIVKVNISYPDGSTVNQTCTPQYQDMGWHVLTYDNFESGWGSYTDGGNECALIRSLQNAHSGQYVTQTKDFEGTNSSFFHTDGIDVDTPGYQSIIIDFWFKTADMDNGDNFIIKYFDGDRWHIIADYDERFDFDNGHYYHKIIWINETDYPFPKNMKIKFQCDASSRESSGGIYDADYGLLYIDDITIKATGIQPTHEYYYDAIYPKSGEYTYFIWTNDTNQNTNTSALYSFHIWDTLPPAISDIMITPDPQEAGGSVNISCSVVDADGIADVKVNIIYPDSTPYNLTMIAGSNYYLEHACPEEGEYSYFIWAKDGAGSTSLSSLYDFEIEKASPPVIKNISATPLKQKTGHFVNISCNVTDNILVEEVRVNITYPNTSTYNSTMSLLPNGVTYYHNQSYELLGTYIYYIWTKDTNGYTNVSIAKQFKIQDLTAPQIVDVTVTPLIQEAGNPVNISCIVLDNYEIDTVWLNITYPDLSTHNFTLIKNDNQYYLNKTYPLLGNYSFTFNANDTSNNMNASLLENFTIQDTLPPVITSIIVDPNPQNIGNYVNISFMVSDNYEIAEVWLNITYPNAISQNISLNSDQFYLNQTYAQNGTHSFIIWANDTMGNTYTTPLHTFLIKMETLLTDPEFLMSINSDDLRANATEQDWYESRGLNTSLLTLDESNVQGNAGKKAKFIKAPSTDPFENAYLTQEFKTHQTGKLSVQWDIYIEEILDHPTLPDRAGFIMIGDASNLTTQGPNSDPDERFVYMAFFKDGGGTTGTMDLIAMDNPSDLTSFITIASGLSLQKWITIRIDMDIPLNTYDISIDGILQATNIPSFTPKTKITHISFVNFHNGSGTFFIDNVHAPPRIRHRLTVDIVGNGTIQIDPGESSYLTGSIVHIEAFPDTNWEFVNWTGDHIGTANPDDITITTDMDIVATFQKKSEEHLITNLIVSWNFISNPFNISIDKNDLQVQYNEEIYSWEEAVADDLIIGYLYSWNRTIQTYEVSPAMLPGEGYWLYANENCVLLLNQQEVQETDKLITHLEKTWNIVGLPRMTQLFKQDIGVLYNGIIYPWSSATSNDNEEGTPLILGFIYGWNRTDQYYTTNDTLLPGDAYWMYASFNCTLLTLDTIPIYTISASSSDGGSIDPSGSIPVFSGQDQNFTIVPNPGYEIEDVIVDSLPVGPVSWYNFKDVTSDHSIEAFFKEAGLMLSLSFNDTTTPIPDMSGNNNDADPYGASWLPNVGGCYEFEATDADYINISDSDTLDGAGTWEEFTLSFWIQPTDNNTNVSLIDKSFAENPTQRSYHIGFEPEVAPGNPTNQLNFTVWTTDGTSQQIIAPLSLSKNNWSHIVCTYNSTGDGLALYINGSLKISQPHTGILCGSPCNMTIGGHGSLKNFYTGLLDTIKLYSRALSSTEIEQQYQDQKSIYIP